MSAALAYHIPVLLKEVSEALVIDPEGVYVDATFGGGGHAREILNRLGTNGRLIGIDCDPEAPLHEIEDYRFLGIREDFRRLAQLLESLKIQELSGILADLGVSSHQLDTPTRGFSYRFEAPLDLRMDQRAGKPACEWLENISEESLAYILKSYGDLPYSRRLASQIRKSWHPGFTTYDLVACARKIYGHSAEKFLSPLFQALRMAINKEREALIALLKAATQVLRPGGRLVILTYHSGEARLVKSLFQNPVYEDPLTGRRYYAWKLLNRVFPSHQEIQENPRCRSAILWVCEKL
ncbi:MAG: 16S rRNA (cytosine(1402)-N(4))-methyltransferase RsmH [Bacteroidia bacterium]|nr:16S rRNA (cytosine(1402)-N(4))-methyltransferase RsmH [Bacteroidia bacterium]MDW8134346.1 16S rRNA (cytosine(1402)-N(4))-methyltransferase RsmH [Bacteroidia bacterium]